MNIRTLLLSAGLLAITCGGATSQQPPVSPLPTPNLPSIGPATPPVTPVPPATPLIPPPSIVLPTVPTRPAPPPEKTVDDLIKELERIQVQKTALEMQERELKGSLRKKLEAQAERLKKLGVTPAAKEAEPDRVGRVIIEGSSRSIRPVPKGQVPDCIGRIIIQGNTKTPDKAILGLLTLTPGEVLNYPALETSRQNLEKAGFRDVMVEVISTEDKMHFKDIRVRVTEMEIAPAPRAHSGCR